jgi:protein-tyrosine phosphatase
MIDIHNHLIYGVDDGSPDLKTSLAMAREAMMDGITHIVCTPHANDDFPYREAVIRERFEELRLRLDGIIDLSLGCDFHMSAENIFAAYSDPFLYSINGRGYLLIEFPNTAISPQMSDALDRLLSVGYKLIVTHPERYPAVQNNPELLADWMRKGCLVQVTANALYGRCGKMAEELSNELLHRRWIHFIATDAHRLTWRPPHMKSAYDYVAKREGDETARRLMIVNPWAAVEGAPWPSQPEPLGLSDHVPLRFNARRYKDSSASPGEAGPKSTARRFWDRLFARS